MRAVEEPAVAILPVVAQREQGVTHAGVSVLVHPGPLIGAVFGDRGRRVVRPALPST